MKKKLDDYWAKTKDLRQSMPNFISNNVFTFEEDENGVKETLTNAINRKLLRYKEIKAVYKKTGIQPAYLIYCLLVGLLFILIGLFDRILTIIIATVYPLYISIKTLQSKIGEEKLDGTGFYSFDDKKKDVTQWLTYWVVYSVFINFEELFGVLLKYIPFYFFIKVIFLIICYIPQYQLARWIYDNCLQLLFHKYETHIIEFSNTIMRSIAINKDDAANIAKKTQ